MSLRRGFSLAAVTLSVLATTPALAQQPYIEFEAGPVRPVALSADRSKLYVCNIPDNRLEIFDVGATGLSHAGSVSVGMSPVAVAARTAGEVWVVNHLSDSVSVVDVSVSPPRVKRTLLVGDEPRDIVFSASGRAFITTAHRGEQRVHASVANVPGAGDPQLTTPSVGRADVWVFSGSNPAPGGEFGGRPERIYNLYGDTPRALAVDGDNVYAAVFYSGNKTSIVNESLVCDAPEVFNPLMAGPCTVKNRNYPGGLPPPLVNSQTRRQPESGIIVRFQNGQWQDTIGRNWDNGVRYHLADQDVFRINAATLDPAVATWRGVGTTIFNMAVNPVTKRVYVTNTEANNFTRFEGRGQKLVEAANAFDPIRPLGTTPLPRLTVQGNLARSQITVLDPNNGNGVAPRALNPHIRYNEQGAPTNSPGASLSTPLQISVSSNGATAYVAGYGSQKIGVIPTSALENGTFNAAASVAASANYIPTGGGPAGFVLDEGRNAMYVLTRFDNAVARIDLGTRAQTQRMKLATPEPPEVINGRPFLYDAMATSGNGEAACASCHIFGDMDHLSWDLGDPDGTITRNPLTILLTIGEALGNGQNGEAAINEFHPNKGPMTTQTLKGMMNHGALHWRGDRTDANVASDARSSFLKFNGAMQLLNGRGQAFTEQEMVPFRDFVARMQLPPNPIRVLENDLSVPHKQLPKVYTADLYDSQNRLTGQTLTRAADPANGKRYFLGQTTPTVPIDGTNKHIADGIANTGLGFTCEGCHTLQPQNGRFGSDGRSTFEGLEQIFKMAQLRNLYTKVGMFGRPSSPILTSDGGGRHDYTNNAFDQTIHRGEQVRGFGYEHEGSVDTIYTFMQARLFERGGFLRMFNGGSNWNIGFQHDLERRDVEAFILAFDNDLAPIVGQQVTIAAGAPADATARLNLIIARSNAQFPSQILGSNPYECDVVAKAIVNGRERGYYKTGGPGGTNPNFTADDGTTIALSGLTQLAATTPVTFTAVPFGTGQRSGVDRDQDGDLDGRDNCPTIHNPDQADDNRDGIGNVCQNGSLPGCSVATTPGTSVGAASLLAGLLGVAGFGVWRRRRRG